MSELVAGSGRRPILVVVAGANGSGKTTLTLQLRGDRWLQGVDYLNPDSIDDAPIRRVLRARDGKLVKTYCEPPHAVARLMLSGLR